MAAGLALNGMCGGCPSSPTRSVCLAQQAGLNPPDHSEEQVLRMCESGSGRLTPGKSFVCQSRSVCPFFRFPGEGLCELHSWVTEFTFIT